MPALVDIGDGLAAIFKIESHNHPSFIEPYQGAATGVGGILRDVFTMGARPSCSAQCAYALEIWANHEKTPSPCKQALWLALADMAIVLASRLSAAKSIFDKSYNGNILVNAMAVGLANSDRIFRFRRHWPRQPGDLCWCKNWPRWYPWGDHGLG